MAATVIDGKALAATVRGEVAERARVFTEEQGRPPGFATVLVGDDPASAIYVRSKHRACEELGISSLDRTLPADATTEQVIAVVEQLADDDSVDGILVQLPMPQQIDEQRVLEAVPPDKDVDGLHVHNVGLLASGREGLRSCTPRGVMRMLDAYEVQLKGAAAVVVGRSNLVGKPVAQMLLERHATVTIAHSRTADLAAVTREADVVVAAVGVPGLIRGDMLKPGAAVIDVGTTRTEDGLRGDVEFDSAAEVAGLLTPVPGGVGPMTIAMLMDNTVLAAEARAAALSPRA